MGDWFTDRGTPMHDANRRDETEQDRTPRPTRPRRRLAAIYLAHGWPVSRAAKRLGMGRTQLHEWLRDPHFRADLDERAEEVAEAMGRELNRARLAAIRALRSIAMDRSQAASERVKAARALLDSDPLVRDFDPSGYVPGWRGFDPAKCTDPALLERYMEDARNHLGTRPDEGPGPAGPSPD
jgi:transposase-like protein